MTFTRTKRFKPTFGKILLAALLILLMGGLVVAAVELVQPGLVRGKLYTAYFVAKAATWEREYPSGTPDTRAIDRLVAALLVPEIANKPAKTWPAGGPEPFVEFQPQTLSGWLPAGSTHAPLSPSASEWKHLTEYSIEGTDWRAPAYDDSTWKTVQAPLVFEPDSELAGLSTVLFSEDAVTTLYFRREFTVADPSLYRLLDVELLGGDGAVGYLNGVEIFRSDPPSAEIDSQALSLQVDGAKPAFTHQTADSALLRPGRNVLAVELRQSGPVNPDAQFDLILRGAVLPESVRFAVIGDYGSGGKHARAVADLVKRWDHGRYGPGADRNRFFPSMGNHDWSDNNYVPSPPNAYLNYFTLPPGQGNERYYDFHWGPVHFFALDSDINEPDGITSDSIQAFWLQERLQASQAPWKLVYMHHPPFASADVHPPIEEINWPFAEWGASLVMSGHNHIYERLEHNNIPYFINGIGGGELYPVGPPAAGSQVRFAGEYGAMLVQATPCSLYIWAITIDNAVIDTLQLDNPAPYCP
jgi:hypothetical protein